MPFYERTYDKDYRGKYRDLGVDMVTVSIERDSPRKDVDIEIVDGLIRIRSNGPRLLVRPEVSNSITVETEMF